MTLSLPVALDGTPWLRRMLGKLGVPSLPPGDSSYRALPGGIAAIDQQIGAGHEAAVLAEEEGGGRGDLLRPPDTADGMLRCKRPLRRLQAALAGDEAMGPDGAGREGIDPDVLPGMVEGHDLG